MQLRAKGWSRHFARMSNNVVIRLQRDKVVRCTQTNRPLYKGWAADHKFLSIVADMNHRRLSEFEHQVLRLSQLPSLPEDASRPIVCYRQRRASIQLSVALTATDRKSVV